MGKPKKNSSTRVMNKKNTEQNKTKKVKKKVFKVGLKVKTAAGPCRERIDGNCTIVAKHTLKLSQKDLLHFNITTQSGEPGFKINEDNLTIHSLDTRAKAVGLLDDDIVTN